MQEAQLHGHHRVVGWEVNGGFLLGADIEVNGQQLGALPTRDAVLPILIALLSASGAGKKVSEVFAALPQRATQAGLINDFPTEVSAKIISSFNYDTIESRAALERYFTAERGFGAITGINSVDGVRIFFDNGDIAHLRPSGNAPQLRIYSVAATQERADQIVAMAIAEPDGIFRQMQKNL
jgi:phosphomannomutase